MDELLIGRIPLFAALPRDELRYLAARLRRCEIAPHSVLFHEGEYGDRFYVVLDGELEIVKALGATDERLLGLRGSGEFVGEMSLLNPDGLRTATVRARTAAQLLELTRADFDALLRRQPTLAYDLARILSLHLQQTNNATIRDLQQKNLELARAYQELRAAQAQIIEKETLERELQVAREIQESILPHTLPRLPGFDFGARMVPARAVGGDFFDFISLGPDTVGIVVGDVSGKGLGAAIFMALARSLLRAEASRAATPREVLASVNRHLIDMNDRAMFVTVLYGLLHRATRDFAYARAGHEMPLLLDAQGAALALERGRGQPLGILQTPLLDEQTVGLPPGGMLLLYTDGVTDAVGPQGTVFGLERLREAVRAFRGAPAQAICDQLLHTVAQYGGAAPQGDDITLIAVQAR